MQSNNPVLKRQVFQHVDATGERMTINGTISKTGLLLVLAVITAAWTWFKFDAGFAQAMQTAVLDGSGQGPMAIAFGLVMPYVIGGFVVGLVLALVSAFKPSWCGITAPLYALAEGFALGGLSAVMEAKYAGIVLQAIMLTAGVLAVMLVAYRAGWIRVTDKFRMGVVAATGAIALLYLVDIGLRAFSSIEIPFIHESGAMGIGFSLLVVGLAALNLVLDFDMIDQGAAYGAPKYMEWYGAFALMVTLVWLYLELLRLLSKTRD